MYVLNVTYLSAIILCVVLNRKMSRWRRQRNGLPQGRVLVPMLFNIYTNDQPVHTDTHSFIYADDFVHHVARKRLQQHISATHVCPEHYDHLLRHEPTACEPFKDTGVCFPSKEPRSQTRTECSVERCHTQTQQHQCIWASTLTELCAIKRTSRIQR